MPLQPTAAGCAVVTEDGVDGQPDGTCQQPAEYVGLWRFIGSTERLALCAAHELAYREHPRLIWVQPTVRRIPA